MAQMPNSSYTGVNQSNNGNINANYVMNGFPHQSTIAQLPMRDPNEPIKKLRFFNEQGVDVMEEVRKNNDVKKDIKKVEKKEIQFNITPTTVSDETLKSRNNFKNLIKKLALSVSTNINVENEAVKEPIKDVEHVEKIQVVKEPEKVLELIKIEFIDWSKFIELKNTFKQHFILPAFFDRYLYMKAGEMLEKYKSSHSIRHREGVRNIYRTDSLTTDYKNSFAYPKERRNEKPVPKNLLKTVENPYDPSAKKKSTEDIFEHVTRDILNKVAPENFNEIADQFVKMKEFRVICPDTEKFIEMIHDKACNEHHFSAIYAKLCKRISVFHTTDKQFINLVLHRIKTTTEETVKFAKDHNTYNDAIKELNPNSDEYQKLIDETKFKKDRYMGNIHFAAFLIKHEVLSLQHVQTILNLFIGGTDITELHLEYLVKMISIAGKNIEKMQNETTEKCGVPFNLNEYFDGIEDIRKDIEVSARVVFLITNLISLKKRKWEPRIKAEGPKLLAEVNQDIADEKHEKLKKDKELILNMKRYKNNVPQKHSSSNEYNKMTKATLEKSGNPFAMSKDKKTSSFESSRKSVKMESKSVESGKSSKLTIGEYCSDIRDYVSNNIELTSIMNICKGIPPSYLKEIFETIITKYLEDSKVNPVKMVTELFIQLNPSLNFKSIDIMSCLQTILKEIHDTISDCPNIVICFAYIMKFAEKVLTNNQIDELFKCVDEDFRRDFFLKMFKYLKEDLELYSLLKKVLVSAICILTLEKFIGLLIDNSLFEVILFSIIWNLCEPSKNITTQLIDHVKNNSFERYSGLIENRLHSKLLPYATTIIKKILSVDSKLLYALVRIISWYKNLDQILSENLRLVLDPKSMKELKIPAPRRKK